MPSSLEGEPPRVTNATLAFRSESQVLKLRYALAQLTQAHKGLNSQPNTRIWLELQISQRESWRVFLWLWLMKNIKGSTSATLESAAPTSGARGVLIPLTRKTSR
jgi:hypothetical protein